VVVKFQLLCNGSPITHAVNKLAVKQVDGTPNPEVDKPTSTAAGTTGNLFRYDSTSQQYLSNLSTKVGYTNPGGARWVSTEESGPSQRCSKMAPIIR
jgi:hypothetical protein